MKKLTPLPKLLSKAQTVFNAWVRDRDKDKGCISCGRDVDHAGHYFSAGHFSALRFDTMNVNGQCLRCNNFLHGNLINYRKGLVKRYGTDRVFLLETSVDLRKSHKWSRIELEAIIQEYGKKSKTTRTTAYPPSE
jgi:hypothetical protein